MTLPSRPYVWPKPGTVPRLVRHRTGDRNDGLPWGECLDFRRLSPFDMASFHYSAERGGPCIVACSTRTLPRRSERCRVSERTLASLTKDKVMTTALLRCVVKKRSAEPFATRGGALLNRLHQPGARDSIPAGGKCSRCVVDHHRWGKDHRRDVERRQPKSTRLPAACHQEESAPPLPPQRHWPRSNACCRRTASGDRRGRTVLRPSTD